MFDLSDTIAAISTPPGAGGIAAIRISGNDSWEIANKVFSHQPSAKSHQPFAHMQALHGYIKDEDKIIDEVILLPYKAPNSFTAEDVVEIFCHGGNKISSMILNLCLKYGARRASNGEFTFRAFINGRIDLTEAEAINDVINAESEKLVHGASNVLAGSLKNKIKDFRNRLLSLITNIESVIEFPRDIPDIKKETIAFELNQINNSITELLNSAKSGHVLRNGVKVSIVGVPNAGKSSLLNQLLETSRAIVTEEAGTTRDTIEEKILLDGYPVVLVDTAGIRKSEALSDSERYGIERSRLALEKSDIALVVSDLTSKNSKEEKMILELANQKSKITVGNKIDLLEKSESETGCDVLISAKYGTNLEKLKHLILQKIKSVDKVSGEMFVNQRQEELLMQCSKVINFAVEILNREEPQDLLADELKKAVSKLDEISGLKVNDEVIKHIFSKFCIGK